MERVVVADARSDCGSIAGANDVAAPLEPSMVCTCVVAIGPKVCFATYNEESNKIIMEESPSSGYDIEVIAERYLALVRPCLLLVGNNIVNNENFLEAITKPLPEAQIERDDERTNNNDETKQGEAHAAPMSGRSIPYRLLRSGAFDLNKCRALILEKLRVLSVIRRTQGRGRMGEPHRVFPQHASGNRTFTVSKYNAVSALINLDSDVQVKSLGGLLSFLESTTFKLEEGGSITVNDIEHAKSSMFMNINANTISALNIFATDHHPLVMANGRGNSKEGSSLFSLLDRTRSHGGRQMLRNWMLKPLLHREDIMSRQDGVELFWSQIDNDSHTSAIIVLLQEIGPIHQILNRLQKCAALPMDFVTTARTMAAASEICRILELDILERLKWMAQPPQSGPSNGLTAENYRASHYIAFIEKILYQCNAPVLDQLHERICSIVDEESTFEARDTIFIRTGFHEELDAWKEQYNGLDEQLAALRQSLMMRYPNLGELAVVFVPQVGFLVGLEKKRAFNEDTGEVRLPLPDDFVHFCNSENGYAYFKNRDVRELDDSIGDLDGLIKDTEAMIVSELEDDILDHETDLRETFLALSELDCVISFAEAAKEKHYTRPVILDNTNGIVRIKNGRHPLQEILVENDFIPNGTNIDPTKRVNIVTGPNFSGKSCYARQVGLLVYLAHLGCFLPCDAAEISIFDEIFAQFSAVETCAVPQSSFQLDLTQMGTILRRSTPKSLVLVDEFGKGTSPASGIALLAAALKKFSVIKTTVVCTTHFLEIFSRGIIKDGENGVKALRMAVHVPTDQADTAEPLFKLEEGVADSSAGIICAKMAGLNRDVVGRAKEIVQALKEGRELEPKEEVNRVISANILTAEAKEAMRTFLQVPSWTDATDEQVKHLLQKIEKL